MIAEFRRVEPYLLGDYYPLTSYSLENTVWMRAVRPAGNR